jgi:tetratricopeptide (TPR) repeat protein
VNDLSQALAAAQAGRLVVFVGAGVSMGSPTDLPSWRDVNRLVVGALASGAEPVVGKSLAAQGEQLILARHEREKLPPEYQAQVLAEFLYSRYFRVLRHLDSDRPNASHLAIAALARLGCVRAVVTTNFDRALEAAFAALEVPLEKHFEPQQFRDLAADLARFDRAGRPCQLLKLHGSVDNPESLIDTLAQRKQGLAAPVIDCVRHLLHSGHWLFLGFSGLDLEAERNYLLLESEAGAAAGFSWLVRENTEPRPAVLRLARHYGDRGLIVSGNLPAWLLELASTLSPEPGLWIDEHLRKPQPPTGSPTQALEQGVKDWAAELGPTVCGLALAFVVIACAEPQAAVHLVERVVRKTKETTPAHRAGPLMGVAANALGLLYSALGRHEEAVQSFTAAIDAAREGGDEDTVDRWRSNLAHSLETLGRIDEAREMYRTAVEGFRTRDDPKALAFGLVGLSSHLIRQMRLDEARSAAEEALEHARRAGDEGGRGIALHNLGMIAKHEDRSESALELFTECETLFARLGNDEATASAQGNRGDVLAGLGRYAEAERLYRSALQIFERIERRDNQGASYLSLGVLEQDRGDRDAAVRWFTRALETFRTIKDPSNEAHTLRFMAQLRIDSEQFEEALALLSAALPLVRDRTPALASDIYGLIGRANMRLGWVGRAEEAYRQGWAVAETLGATRGASKSVASHATNLGTALMVRQANGEAADVFARAAALWQQLGDRENEQYCRSGEEAVRLDDRIAALSEAGHASPDPAAQRAAAREMVRLYPELIARYEQLGVQHLVAAFCASAASSARFIGEVPLAIDWYAKGATIYQELGMLEQARELAAKAARLGPRQ